MKNGSLSWNPNLKTKGEALLKEIRDIPVDTFTTALDQVAFKQLDDFQRGVKAYHAHPFVRDVVDPDAIWEEGNSRLLDYGGPKDGPVLFCVPSLINRAYILDLSARRSFVRSMADKGLRVYLLDWGPLGPQEQSFQFDDYITGRLARAMDFVQTRHPQKINLLGYCMGGVMALAYGALFPDRLQSLCLLATPWDFHGGDNRAQQAISASRPALEMNLQMMGVLSVDVIQGLFSAIDPWQVIHKFQKFADQKPASAKAEHFVAMEDWLNDGVCLAAPVARSCLFDWYMENQTFKGQWQIKGEIIDPTRLTCPCLVYVADRDRIVQPESSLVLADILPNAQIRRLDSGHVSMVCGQKAVGSLYTPLSKWLLNHGM